MHATIQAMTIFVRAVEKNSFVGAARSLLIDPAAVSRAVNSLETDLGVRLFTRSTRAMKLTADGARFHRDCTQILQKFTEATQRFRVDRTAPHGRLTVGMTSGLTRRMMLQALSVFQQQYPQIEIVLLSVDDLAEIGDKGVDVLVRPRGLRQRGGQHSEAQGLVVRKLAQSCFVACASPEYLDRAGAPRTPADLLRHACVALVSVERDVLDEWPFVKSQMRQKIKLVPKLLVQGNDALREAGVAGCGIIRPSTFHVEDELRSRKLVPILPDWECTGSPTLVAVYRKTRPMPAQVSVFVQYLAQAFQRYNLPASSTR